MRILHIIDTMDPAAGGPTELVRMLARYTPPGSTSEIVTTDAATAPFLHNLPCPAHGLGDSTGRFYTPALLPWLRANRTRFDGVLVHGLWQWVGVAARLACNGHIPYSVFPHGMLDPYFKRTSPAKHLKKYPFWLLAESWNLRAAHRTLFTTEAERDLAAQSFHPYACRPAVVALGAEPAPPPTPQHREAFYTACPAVRGHRFLLYLGRIHPKKGADLLLEAFASIATQTAAQRAPQNTAQHAPQTAAQHAPQNTAQRAPQNTADDPSLHLVMAGPDSDNWSAQLQQNLPPAIAARIHWPGLLLGDAKHGAFAAAEAFILPSHQENFGIAVVEALAASTPALITHPVNIAPEIVANHAGFAAADTPEGIRSLLLQWLALSPAERETLSANALTCFQQHYDMRRNAEAIFQTFAEPRGPLAEK